MAKISTYAIDAQPTLADKVIGTEVDNHLITKNYTIGDIIALVPGGGLSVQSLNSLTGALTLTGTGGITITEDATNGTITIDGGGSGGSGVSGITSGSDTATGGIIFEGSGVSYNKDTNTFTFSGGSGGGITSITGPGGSVTGAITLTGAGVSQSGNTFTFSGGSGSSGGPENSVQVNKGGGFDGYDWVTIDPSYYCVDLGNKTSISGKINLFSSSEGENPSAGTVRWYDISTNSKYVGIIPPNSISGEASSYDIALPPTHPTDDQVISVVKGSTTSPYLTEWKTVTSSGISGIKSGSDTATGTVEFDGGGVSYNSTTNKFTFSGTGSGVSGIINGSNTATGGITFAGSGVSYNSGTNTFTFSGGSGGGSVNSVQATGTVSGLSLSLGGTATDPIVTLGGTLSLTSSQITTGLGFTPYNSTNPSNFINQITTTGTSGPATISGTTINVPQYTPSSGGITGITGPGGSVTGGVTFTGGGISQSGNTFTFSGGGSNPGGKVKDVQFHGTGGVFSGDDSNTYFRGTNFSEHTLGNAGGESAKIAGQLTLLSNATGEADSYGNVSLEHQGGNFVSLAGSTTDAAGSNYFLHFPADLPESNDSILQSSASGQLEWISTPSGGGGITSITGPSGGVTGGVTFTGAGVTQSGNTFTFSGGGSGTNNYLTGASYDDATGLVTYTRQGLANITSTGDMRTKFTEIGKVNPGATSSIRPPVDSDNIVRFGPQNTSSNIGATSYGVVQTTTDDTGGTVITFANPGTYWIELAVAVVIPSPLHDGFDTAFNLVTYPPASSAQYAADIRLQSENSTAAGRMWFGNLVNGVLVGSTRQLIVFPEVKNTNGSQTLPPNLYTAQFSITTTAAGDNYKLACFQLGTDLVSDEITATPMQFATSNQTPTGSSVLSQPMPAEITIYLIE